MNGSSPSGNKPILNGEPADANSNHLGGEMHNGAGTKLENGILKKAPDIPHITNNIIPLSNVLKFYTQEAYKQLTTAIENLSSTKDTENDSSRKKFFLHLIISLRQDFIKIYTLVKWASSSKDVSKLIDLLNWFRSQDFYFEQLGYGLNELNRYSGAKLPNSDIITSLEVFIKKRPQLPSYNLINTPPISSEKTLEVLKDLNLTLMTRMALITNLPKRFINNYEIKDGRVYLTIPNEFQVSVTVGNDLIIEQEEDYYKSPFYFIDFKFLFGINPETSLITHKDNKIITKLPQSSFLNLEKIVNTVLLNLGLGGLYDLLHKYSISFKLYLIARQLKDISINSKWRNNIQFKYQNGKSLILINYWSSHYLSKNWKSFIELGIDKNYNLNFRWFKNGTYELNHGISGIFDRDNIKKQLDVSDEQSNEFNPEEESMEDMKEENKKGETEAQDLSVDLILNIIVNKHSEMLMAKIYENIIKRLPDQDDEYCSFISCHQLLLKLTPSKSVVFAINPLTGFFYFMDPSPIQNQVTKKINTQSSNNKNKLFFSENDMIENIVNHLIQLKLEMFNKEINNKLITSGWINNEIIRLNDYETVKLLNFLNGDNTSNSNFNKIQFYRCKNWPLSWFLSNLVSGDSFKTFWWVARIKSIKGEWKIQWVQQLVFDKQIEAFEELTLDYKFFSNLSSLCSNMIIDHMVLEELQAKRIQYIKKQPREKAAELLNKFQIDEEQNENIKYEETNSPSVYESIIMLYNDNRLLPVSNSSTSLFLKIKLITLNNSTQMKLKLFGNLRNIPNTLAENFNQLNLHINKSQNYFEISDIVNLSNKINDSSIKEARLLDPILLKLNVLNELIKVLYQLNQNNIEILDSSIESIQIKIDEQSNNLTIKLPEMDEKFRLLSSNSESNEMKLIISYLNKYLLMTSKVQENEIIGIIKYLKEITPIIKSIRSVRSILDEKNIMKLSNGLNKLNFDVEFQNLNLIQFVYFLNNTNTNSNKKILKDKIVIKLNFMRNKFNKQDKLLLKLSMKDNLNSRNLKYKKLFELIYKGINEVDNTNGLKITKLNYDFIVDSLLINELMVKITDAFIHYLSDDA
mmetsp:Transcript_1133/g.1352  ORF Transcript_1133/g.1352 Transcript_1133/m.1352 type:complete len:1087 (-) Transcript_1133:1876-5136(-)